MSGAGTLYVAIKGDTKDLISALKAAKAESISYGKQSKQAIDPVGKSLDYVKSQVIALGSAYIGLQGIKAIIGIADQYSLLDSKLKLVTASTTEYAKVHTELFRISQTTGTSFAANATQYSNLGMALKDLKISSGEMLGMFDTLNKSIVVAGASTSEAAAFLQQFKQGMASGKFAGDEFKSMMENNSYFGLQLAKALKTDVDGLYKMKEAGELTTAKLREAFPAMAAQINSDFEGIQKTIGRAMTELTNSFESIVDSANKTTGATSNIATSISNLATTITENKDGLASLFVGLIRGAEIAVTAIGKVGEAWQHLYNISEAQTKGKPVSQALMMSPKELQEWLTQNQTMSAGMKDLIAKRDEYLEVVAGYDKALQVRKQLFAEEQNEYNLAKAQVENLNAQIASHSAVTTAIKTTAETSKQATTETVEGNKKIAVSAKETADKIVHIKANEYELDVERQKKKNKNEEESFDIWLRNQMAIVEGQKTTTDTFVVLEGLKGDAIKETGRKSRETLSEMEVGWLDFAHGTQSTFASVIGEGLRGEINSIGEAWNALMNGMVNSFINAAANMAAQNISGSLFGTSATKDKPATEGYLTPVFDAVESWWNSTDFFAEGGTHTGGLRVVGEKGPELEFTGPSTILSNADSKSWLSSMSSGGKISDKFGALAQAMQQSGMSAEQAKKYIYEMANATAVYTAEISGNSSAVADAIEQTSESTTAVATHAEITKENTAATEKESAAKTTAKEKSFDLTNAMVDVAFGIAEVGVKSIAAATGVGILGYKAAEFAATAAGFTAEVQGWKESIKGAINEVQAAMGFAQDAAARFESSYNAEGFPGYTPGDLYGESTDPGAYGDSDSGFGGYGGDLSGESTDPEGYYATGGIHRGGWRIVGERGPELEFTPPSRIFSNSDSRSMLAGAQKSQPINLTIPVSVGGKHLETIIVNIADGVATARQKQGTTGGAYRL